MQITLDPVERGDSQILMNLLEKYACEFSQYDRRDVNAKGLYHDDGWLDFFWNLEHRWAYFIRVDGQLAGFVMVNDYPETKSAPCDYCLTEFFVLHKYRRMGVGSYAARTVWEQFHGFWQLMLHPNNLASVSFWKKAVSDYTNGAYQTVTDCSDAQYEDGTPAVVYLFQN